MVIGKIETILKIKVKFSLWAAIKLRIAGIKNITEDAIEASIQTDKEQ